jgi:hypothetical protein
MAPRTHSGRSIQRPESRPGAGTSNQLACANYCMQTTDAIALDYGRAFVNQQILDSHWFSEGS